MPATVAICSECVTGTFLSDTVSLLGGQSVSGNEPAEEEDERQIQ